MKEKMNQATLEFWQELQKNLGSIKNKPTFIKQIPNFVTLIRLFFLPFIIFHILANNLLMAGILTIIAIISDFFDGLLARKLNATTKFGAKLDSISDKIFFITILAILVHYNYLILIVIFFDLTIALITSHFTFMGLEVTTNYIGKIKTVFLSLFIISLFFPFLEPSTSLLLFITILLQVITLISYLKKALTTKQKKDFNELV